jgi:hypothetical protein
VLDLSQSVFELLYFRIYNFVMHLLKSMGGGAFGTSKPASTNAKSSYFSSLKLEYSSINSAMIAKNRKVANKKTKARSQLLQKVSFPSDSP